jgi:hypothetical protein
MFFVYNQAHNIIAPRGTRATFDQPITNALHPVRGVQDICHSLSFNVLQSTLDFSINDFLNGRVNLANCYDRISSITNAVFRTILPLPGSVLFNVRTNVYAALTNLHLDLQQLAFPLPVPPNPPSPTMPFLCAHASTLLNGLNNGLENLRAGSLNWNRSIGVVYDPTYWLHFNAAGVIDYSYLGSGVVPANSVALPKYPAKGAYYIYGPNDEYHLRLAINNAHIHYLIHYWTGQDPAQGGFFLYSSSNTFALIPAGRSGPATDPIYALNNENLADTWWNIMT